MSKEQTYELIGKIAGALYGQRVRISLASLNAILRDHKAGYGSTRGLAKGVTAAYEQWERNGDHITAEAIAHTFTDRNGNLAWQVSRERKAAQAKSAG